MKKLLLLSALVMSCSMYSQSVPNGGFESWNTVNYNDPTGWTNGNIRDIQKIGSPSVTRINGFSGFGIRIQTTLIPDTSESYIINTNNPCNDPPQWKGGVPYAQQPTGITGYYRYNLPGNDTALMIIIFRKNGAHIGDNLIKIRGTGSQPSWTAFNYTLSVSGVPDSVIIAATSSNKISNANIQNGSFLEFDNLAFAGASQPIPNGNFENWTAMTYDSPAGWSVESAQTPKTAAGYSGTSALRLETTGDCGGGRQSMATTGKITNYSGPKGGLPYTATIDTLCGYYKYTSMGSDTASINISLSKNGVGIGGNQKKLVAASNYVYFQVPFSSGVTPDTLRIDIMSSKWPMTGANIGSVLYIDNLYLKSQPLSVREQSLSEVSVVLYPNPVKDVVMLKDENETINSVAVYNMLGENKGTWEVKAGEFSLDMKSFAADVYFIQVITAGGTVTKKLIKQ